LDTYQASKKDHKVILQISYV